MVRALAGGPRTLDALRGATGLPSRTLRFALRRLREHGLVEERRLLGDARRKRFSLRGPEGPRQASPQFTQ